MTYWMNLFNDQARVYRREYPGPLQYWSNLDKQWEESAFKSIEKIRESFVDITEQQAIRIINSQCYE
jgi:hypothetical protein